MIIDFAVCKQRIIWPKECFIIADSVGYVYIRGSFDSDWDGLTKRFVFSNGDIIRSVLVTSDAPIAVPHEVLAAGKLNISVVGISENGEKKLTTRKMPLPITVFEAGPQDGEAPEQYTPELWEQVLSAVGDMSELETQDKSTLVAAINEVAVTGGNSGESGTDGTGISSIEFKETDSDGGNVYTITLTDGTTYDFTAPKGEQGNSGAAKTISGVTIKTRTSSGCLIGDINGDGAVNEADVESMLQAIINGDSLNTEAADFNGDGIVNNADSFILEDLVTNLESGQAIAKITVSYNDGTTSDFYGFVTDHYTKAEINAIMDNYITDIDELVGGEG